MSSRYTRALITRFSQLAGAAAGLQYLHDNGIVHGAVMATNVLVSTDLQPLISGFSSVKVVGEGDFGSNAPSLMARWLSPEYSSKDRRMKTPWSDIWSFGMLIYEVGAVDVTHHPALHPDTFYAGFERQNTLR